MRVPLDWLRSLCDDGLPTRALEERLTMTGTKVEAVHHHGVTELEHFVVGKVLSREQHPDADRLSVCMVDTGLGEPSQIVCGAKNVDAGQTVAVARPGSVMPDGTRLKKAKLRGVESHGMILAEDEVGIGGEHWGIMVLDDALPAGTPLQTVLPITTDVLELEITPNRPDCLGVYGVAREVHAITGKPIAHEPWRDDPGSAGDVEGVEVVVECPDLCPRFTLRAFENVTIGPSPVWLKQRLSAAGQRPINNVVDITNYVMLLTGQPLHAFDADRVEGSRLVVRRARDGEKVTTLDEIERTLDDQMVVIDDAAGPTSIAGVMGGNRSEVHDGTTRVLMEAATWIGHNIQRTSTRLALRSEASGRFEKQLSVEATMEAQAVAAILMVELTGATLVPGTIDVFAEDARRVPQIIRLRDARLAGLLGHSVPRARSAEILTALGFAVTEAEDGLDARVPHWRASDVTREADLVEEVARVDGLDRLPATLPSRRGAVGVLSRDQKLRRRAEDALVGCGLHEIVGWSFTTPDHASRLGLSTEPIPLQNPMSEDQSVMRVTLLGSLLDAARHNAARGMADVAIFETGAVYLPWGDSPNGDVEHPSIDPWAPPAGSQGWIARRERRLPDERRRIGALLTGAQRPASWLGGEAGRWDFFAAKGVLEALLGALRVPWSVEASREERAEPFLHPGRGARVLCAGAPAGWLGELHPSIARAWDLEGAAGFELDLMAVLAAAPETLTYEDLTSFPAVRQDIAVVVGDDVPAEAVLEAVRASGGKTLRSAEVFDVYRGAQVGEGRASLALRLEFRAPDRTLTDSDVAKVREKIVAALRDRVGGELRG